MWDETEFFALRERLDVSSTSEVEMFHQTRPLVVVLDLDLLTSGHLRGRCRNVIIGRESEMQNGQVGNRRLDPSSMTGFILSCTI